MGKLGSSVTDIAFELQVVNKLISRSSKNDWIRIHGCDLVGSSRGCHLGANSCWVVGATKYGGVKD